MEALECSKAEISTVLPKLTIFYIRIRDKLLNILLNYDVVVALKATPVRLRLLKQLLPNTDFVPMRFQNG